MKEGQDSRRIAANGRLSEIIARYPQTGPVFLQHGRMFVARGSELYARYPGLTVREYAALHEVDLNRLLERLNLVAEAEEFTRATASRPQPTKGRDSEQKMRPDFATLGYTGSYREPRADVEGVPVVTKQTAQGPD